ncbi:MAG: hypothetical protein OEV59_07520 [Deltaproteobacteria bacterium]|nr:hypothetical protein [Deltaproteobacteria bacterium]
MQTKRRTVEEALIELLHIEKRAAAVYRHFAMEFAEDGSSEAWLSLAKEEDTHAAEVASLIEWSTGFKAREITSVASAELDRITSQFDALEPLAMKKNLEPAEAIALAQAMEAAVNEGNIARVLSISVPELKTGLGALTDDCIKHMEIVSTIARTFYQQPLARQHSA